MLRLLRKGALTFETVTPPDGWRVDDDVLWVDLLKPTREEELAVEAALGLDLPTLAEMQEIEPSSRFYQEAGATFMTVTVLARSDEPTPEATPVTFVLARRLLVTLRYAELKAFRLFVEHTPQMELGSGAPVLFGLLDAIVQREADILEALDARVGEVSAAIFQPTGSISFRPLLTNLASAQSVTNLVRNSLVSLTRMLSFGALAPEIAGDPECRTHLKSLQRDVQSLTEHSSYLSGQITFMLDAALGLINIEQNGIIKFFSVVAVVFLPPTLVASIYGMNFRHMPELAWPLGYPMAIGMMLASAILPVLWFKRRGWL